MILIGFRLFTLVGFCMQMWGMFLMFKSFLKTIYAYMQTLPVVGPVLRDSVMISNAVNWVSSKGNTSKSSRGADIDKFEV